MSEEAMGWSLSSSEQMEYLRKDIRKLKDENAKLRELVREMHATISRYNSWWDYACKDTRRFADELRELGVEVKP